MPEKIIIGSDHGGFTLKEILKKELEKRSFEVIDVGCHTPESVNYPQIGAEVAKEISSGAVEKGILICGTGIGMSITANRYEGVRATLCHDHLTAKLSREHNNSNVLVLGDRVTGVETAKNILDTWLSTEFEGGRHLIRIDMIEDLSKK